MRNRTLKRVLRLDQIELDKSYFTEEGYLIDFPIVTTTGIFEYMGDRGETIRELRLPEHVFDPESLASYEGKPVIITHDAVEVDKDNVREEIIGTILSAGQRDGDSVRCKIVIHDTEAMQGSQLKELSLGYDLDDVEQSGVWNGQPYDVIQTNIRINHLALVGKARAGPKARLNIDGCDHDTEILRGAKKMAKQVKKRKKKDGEGFQSAVDSFHERRDQRLAEKQGDNEGMDNGVLDNEPIQQDNSNTDQAQSVRDNRDSRDLDGDPDNMDSAMDTIAKQDEDIETLLGVIEALQSPSVPITDSENQDDQDNEHGDNEGNEDNEDNEDDEDDAIQGDSDLGAGQRNADSVDKIIRDRIRLGKIGQRINLDDLEELPVLEAKKRIIQKMKPSIRLDGVSVARIDGMFDIVVADIESQKKDTNYQRGQMTRQDGRGAPRKSGGSANKARENMISRQQKGGD